MPGGQKLEDRCITEIVKLIHKFEFTEATTIRIFLTLRSVEEKSTDSTVRECKKK